MKKLSTKEQFGNIKNRNQLILDFCQQERNTIEIQDHFNMANNTVNGIVKIMVKHNYLQKVDKLVIRKDNRPRIIGHYTALKKVYDFNYSHNKPAKTSKFEHEKDCAIQNFLNQKYLSGLIAKLETVKTNSLVVNGWR